MCYGLPQVSCGFWVFHNGDAWTKLDIQHVCYLETFNHHIYFHTDDGKEFKRMGNFNDLHTELTCNPLLFRCHKSYVVNGLFVEAMTQGSFLMKDGRKISISRPYRKASRKFFAQSVSQQCSWFRQTRWFRKLLLQMVLHLLIPKNRRFYLLVSEASVMHADQQNLRKQDL